MYIDKKILMGILLSLFFVCCSKNSSTEHIFILDEIPKHIQEVENLTVFSGDSKPSHSMKLISEQHFGEIGEPYLSEIMGCVVDDNGRVIIWNIDSKRGYPPPTQLYVYNPDGTYYDQIGRIGSGPGEYGLLYGIKANAESVFAIDGTNKRLNVYNTGDYTFDHSSVIGQWSVIDDSAVRNMSFGNLYSRNDGNHLAVFFENFSDSTRIVSKYLLIDTDGNELDFKPLIFPSTINVINGKSMMPSSLLLLPFMGNTISALTEEDDLYSVWTMDFLIKKYDAKGIYQSAIYYPVTGTSFELDEYTNSANYNRSDVMNTLEKVNEELPKTNPIIADLKIDDENRIWVAVTMGVNSVNYEWWILKENGELLAKLVLPRDQPIYDIKKGYMYSKITNEETGTEYVVKYRIELIEQ